MKKFLWLGLILVIFLWQTSGTNAQNPPEPPETTPTPTQVITPSPTDFDRPTVPPIHPSLTPTPIPTSTPVPTATPIPVIKVGDANGDDQVDDADYLIWKSHYNQNVSGRTNGDFNDDNKADGIDYVIWWQNYGK